MPEKDNVNILIVDDKVNNIFALEQMLLKPDRNFLSATNGNEALKTALNKEIDLIILDVQMPEMDGFEVAQILKSNKRTREIPIIFASAEKTEHQFMLKGFEEGAVDYLYKPLNKELTEAKVSVLLELHLQKKKLLENNLALEKYALLINNSADLICIINAGTLILEEVNQAVKTMLGYSVDEVKGTSLLLYLAEDHAQDIQSLCDQKPESASFETRVYDKDGNRKWLDWNIVCKDRLWFANARDITNQKKAEKEIKQLNADLKQHLDQLKETNKELESFSYSVSHDLRAPLRAINGYANIIREDYKDNLDDELKRLLQVIQDNAKRMGRLIDDLLGFSKLGRKELVKTRINTASMIEQIIGELNGAVKDRVNFKLGELLPLEGDYTLLYQVFVNLISNAVKYSSKKESPQVEIGSYPNDHQVTYYIRDNGTGFSMDYAHKLFGVFQRLHTDAEFEGTGVGLAIVQRVILKHGGQVWAEGEPDKGATFYFSLPKP